MSATEAMPSAVLGTMTFGIEGQVKKEQARDIIKAFVAAGHTLIDTARIYQQSTPDGDTETILGEILAEEPEIRAKVKIHTKVNAMCAPWRSLSRQAVLEQCNICLQKLRLQYVDLLYLHSPDIKTDIEDTLEAIQQLYQEGKIKEFGLSNYPAWKVVDIWHRCKSRGTVLPTVYQGMYNIITRDMEREIVPVAREFGMRMYMYNPLAGGLLSGRYCRPEDLANATEGRFSQEFDNAFGTAVKAGKLYQARYSKEEFFSGLEKLRASCEQASISMPSAALRWLLHHSYLSAGEGDGIIFGVSRMDHMHGNLSAWASDGGGPLPEGVLQACEAAWAVSRPACESYFRGYGAKPGGIEEHVKLLHNKKGNL